MPPRWLVQMLLKASDAGLKKWTFTLRVLEVVAKAPSVHCLKNGIEVVMIKDVTPLPAQWLPSAKKRRV